MSEVLLRKDVPAQAQWQTSHIYASQEEWEKDFQWVQEKARELASYAGTLKNGKDVVLSLLKTYAESSEHLSRLYTYASCNLNVDNGDSFNQSVMARTQTLYAQYSAAVAFLSPELLKLPKATLKGYIADPDFGDFDVFLRIWSGCGPTPCPPRWRPCWPAVRKFSARRAMCTICSPTWT